MRYVAVLNGEEDLFEKVASCFAGESARITRFGQTWALESIAFSSCAKPRDVFPIADALVSRMRRVLRLYSGLDASFSVQYIEALDATGRPCKRGLRGNIRVNVYDDRGLVALSTVSGGITIGAKILQ